MSSPRPLVVLGAGGFARETVQLLRVHPASGSRGESYEVTGFLDDDPRRTGTRVDGVPVLGPTEQAGEHAARGAVLLACVGNPGAPLSRQQLVARLGLPDEVWATVVHPLASVSPDSVVGPGSVLHAGVVLTHDDEVADAATFGAGVRLAGGVSVRPAAYVGSGALVREGRRIGAGAVVGIGAVVLRDVPAGETWAGNPARPLSISAGSGPAGPIAQEVLL